MHALSPAFNGAVNTLSAAEKANTFEFASLQEGMPVPAYKLAASLNPEPLIWWFEDKYKNFDVVKNRLAPRIRFFAYLCLSSASTIMEAYRRMISMGFWRDFGFKKPPTYELLREFIYEKIGVARFRDFFVFLLKEITRTGETLGIQIGERIAEDATDTYCLKCDPEAEYSGYYQHYGYKVDIVQDLEHPHLPLWYRVMGINENEGKNLPQAISALRAVGCKVKEVKVDGKYATYENIAYCGVNEVELKYRIQVGWTYNEKGTDENVKKTYQKYWQSPDFVPGARLQFQLRYLYEKGEIEAVGAYFRNKRTEVWKSNPDQINSEMGERSGKMEGFYGVYKDRSLIGRRPRKRGKKEIERIVGLANLAHLFSALISLQNGITDNLGCLTYIT